MRTSTVVALAIVGAALVCTAAAKTQWHQLHTYTFEDYKKEFGKTYGAIEHGMRKALFERRLDKIRRHNSDPTRTWKEGVNHMTDWTDDEFKRLGGYDKAVGASFHRPDVTLAELDISDLPKNVDWRDHGVVTTVKDQGQCGSCWSFATAETLESHWAIKTGVLSVLSEQNVLDCVPNPDECGGTGGCQGGTAELAYTQLKNKGLASEWTYPYQSWHGKDFKCQYDPKETATVANITGYVKLGSNKYTPLMDAVANKGPIAVSVEASHWRDYESGVFDGCNQTNPDIDHAVVLVGYGTTEKGEDYWLVRNSWTPLWGDHGYIKIKRTENEESRCGTDITPQDGSGCKGGPATVKVCGTCGILYDSCYPTVE